MKLGDVTRRDVQAAYGPMDAFLARGHGRLAASDGSASEAI
jgi:hypothetical protein